MGIETLPYLIFGLAAIVLGVGWGIIHVLERIERLLRGAFVLGFRASTGTVTRVLPSLPLAVGHSARLTRIFAAGSDMPSRSAISRYVRVSSFMPVASRCGNRLNARMTGQGWQR